MKLYIFKGKNKEYVSYPEKDAHNYLRHKSNWERKDLVYLGSIDEGVVAKKINEISLEVRKKYGTINPLDDAAVSESRAYAEELMGDQMTIIYKKVDKKDIPRNFDVLGESGDISKNKGIFKGMIGS